MHKSTTERGSEPTNQLVCVNTGIIERHKVISAIADGILERFDACGKSQKCTCEGAHARLCSSPFPGEMADLVGREQAKSAAAARLVEEEAQRVLTRQLRAALRAPSPERTYEVRALLLAHPEEAAQLRAAMDKTAARKLQKEVNETEVEEDESTLQCKVVQLADMIRAAKHVVVYTGAGVSTAAEIPDYRGPQGIWTLHKKGEHNANASARAVMMGKAFVDARPTLSHMALSQLGAKGLMKQLISQNVDGLHLRR